MKHSARCNEFKRILNQESWKVHVIFAIAGGGGYCDIWAIYMVYKSERLGLERISFFRKLISWLKILSSLGIVE